MLIQVLEGLTVKGIDCLKLVGDYLWGRYRKTDIGNPSGYPPYASNGRLCTVVDYVKEHAVTPVSPRCQATGRKGRFA